MTENIVEELTLYKLRQNEEALAVVPSKALSKLCGFSTFICPPRATKPVMITKMRTKSLKTPRMFCRRRPHFSAVPWISIANVTQANPTARSVQGSGSLLAARNMYSPKTREFPAAQAESRLQIDI